MKSEALEIIRNQIVTRAKFKYPRIRNFNISDDFIKEKMKEHKGDIELIVDDLYTIVGVNKFKRKRVLFKVIK